MTEFDSDRRKLLKAGGATMLIGLAGCIGPFEDSAGVPGTVERVERDNGDDDDWLENVPNWDGEVVDLTGEDEIEIENGEVRESGEYVYEPAEVQIDPGTTVRWIWVGDAGHTVTHEVEDEDDREFDSGNISGEGETFEHTFEDTGVFDYYCVPHRSLEQKGRVRVGDTAQIEDWMADVPNWDGSLEDFTGEDSVEILNGEPDEPGEFVYDPPGVTVDAGTTITWEWVGDAGHSVTHEVDDDEEEVFDSGNITGDGETFEFTFEEGGVYLYYCIPHRGQEQKGVVVVEE